MSERLRLISHRTVEFGGREEPIVNLAIGDRIIAAGIAMARSDFRDAVALLAEAYGEPVAEVMAGGAGCDDEGVPY